MSSPSGIAANLARITERIAAASARRTINQSKHVQLVAVSKFQTINQILEACQAGQRHFGENYVQELFDKATSNQSNNQSENQALLNDIKWHFIGHLQSNKAKTLVNVPNLYCVECVDTVKLANTLNKAWREKQSTDQSTNQSINQLRMLIQVNTSNEQSKSGCAPEETVKLFDHVLTNCRYLKPVGLMTIGSLTEQSSPKFFQMLAKLGDDVISQLKSKMDNQTIEEFELSMGMSGDFEMAIECGSTNVRVGSSIFGARASKEEIKQNQSNNQSNDQSEQTADMKQ